MEGESGSWKYLLLHLWCGLLTVAMVALAVILTSNTPKSTEETFVAPLKPGGSSFSYIQLTKSAHSDHWQHDLSIPQCDSCHLVLRNNSIFCTKDCLYVIYAQVTFRKHPVSNQTYKSVILKRNALFGKIVKVFVEGRFPVQTQGSVWVAKVVNLQMGDNVVLEITDKFQTGETFWGAYQLC